MFFTASLWNDLMMLIGEVTVILIVGMLIGAVLVMIVAGLSIQNGQFYFPRLMKSGMVLLEGVIKGMCKFFGFDDTDLVQFSIKLQNMMNTKRFAETPVEKRVIYLPQCLRSAECPAHLTPEGLVCRRCGRCDIGREIDAYEAMGYRVFIAPGSTLIKRMMKKYRPKAIIGIGCLMEIKEGLELCDRAGVIGMGVVTLKDGCVETVLNWDELHEIAAIGITAPGSR
ncbi:DUF116 domain-containing protein [uncultured Methanofollis sp.]|uniref:DUF116 domain-containing protein n=1 Tax=uncultured Methanofollis sp. TaxID=262500 RepID=UPI00262F32B5|nr:DUF116 domain-containing protein [uncultured Methanofollis sp.]